MRERRQRGAGVVGQEEMTNWDDEQAMPGWRVDTNQDTLSVQEERLEGVKINLELWPRNEKDWYRSGSVRFGRVPP